MISEISLSPEFKTQTTKAVVSIVLFVILYLLLVAMGVGLTLLCLYIAILLVASYASLITIALAIGIGSMGFMVLFFLIKFIFKSHKVDRTHLYEIKRADEPELFSIIDAIVKQVDTTFPKKVYLSADVNACVFYDSSFWSMFFPIRKNLQIGLGLVNSVSKEELKSILAHEFGHFSQKTMKVGSYVYNVNQVIFNLLHDNESFDKMIIGWANISGYFALFVVVAIKIINVVQWILGKMYSVVNKSYMGLSREMEFHADEIAAHVTGHEPLKTSLLRLDLAGHSYNEVLSFYQKRIGENFKSDNIFKEQSFVMNFLARDSEIPVRHKFPQVPVDQFSKFNKSKLVIKDQWASHPSTADRVKRLESLNLPAPEADHKAANLIFKDIEKTQKTITEKLFKDILYEDSPKQLPLADFQSDFQKNYASNAFAKIYNGYYDNKNPATFRPYKLGVAETAIAFDDLFSNEKIDLVYTGVALENDMEVLKQIANKQLLLKTFDYDGKKYKRKESNTLINQLDAELKIVNEQVKENDLRIFKFFRALEKEQGEDLLVQKYTNLFAFDKTMESKGELYSQLMQSLDFVQHTTPYDQIARNFDHIATLEKKLKSAIEDMMGQAQFQQEITGEMKENLDLYLSKEWSYFGNEQYFDQNLALLYDALNSFAFLLSRGYFLLKKEILDYQKELLNK